MLWYVFTFLAPAGFALTRTSYLRKNRRWQVCLALLTLSALILAAWLYADPPQENSLSHTAVPWCFFLNFASTAATFIFERAARNHHAADAEVSEKTPAAEAATGAEAATDTAP